MTPIIIATSIPACKSLSRDIAEHNQRSSILIVRHNLKEVSTYFTRRSVLAFDMKIVQLWQFIRNQDLLNMPRLRDLHLPLFLHPVRNDEPPQQHHRNNQQ